MSSRPNPIAGLLREVVLHMSASPLLEWRRLETLRGLDDHLLRDIGITSGSAASGRRTDKGIEVHELYDSIGTSRAV